MNFNLAPEDDPGVIHRATGPCRELGICPVCGEDVPDTPRFGDVTCGAPACRDAAARRAVDPWLSGQETR